MLHRLILKVTKFQLPPPKRLSTDILGAIMPPRQMGLTDGLSMPSFNTRANLRIFCWEMCETEILTMRDAAHLDSLDTIIPKEMTDFRYI